MAAPRTTSRSVILSSFSAHVRNRWYRGVLHFVATLVSILLALSFAIRMLVTAPLDRLLEGIRKTEMGYWGEVAATGGAWEVRWVIWRFRNMGCELEKTVRQLLDAQVRANAAMVADERPETATREGLEKPEILLVPSPGRGQVLTAHELAEICARLEGLTTPSVEDLSLARKTLAQHAVVAEALGDLALKSRLENASLRVLQPTAFQELENRLTDYSLKLSSDLSRCQVQLEQLMEENMVPVVDIQARTKHIAGIFRKMKAKGLDFEQVHDLFAIRIVVPSESDCYRALGLVHETFFPLVGRFKDYNADPKPNGYRSIHTCIRFTNGVVVEIQIRSLAMHRCAENGAASHLEYKKKSSPPKITSASGRAAGGGLGLWLRSLLR